MVKIQKEHQCQQLEAQYNMAMNSIGELQASIQRLSVRLNALNRKWLDELQAELGTASNEIATKDDKISELRKELDARLEEFNKVRNIFQWKYDENVFAIYSFH